MTFSYNEFHISRTVRNACNFSEGLFSSSGNVILANLPAVRTFQAKFNEYLKKNGKTEVSAGTLNAMGLLDEVFHLACWTYRRQKYPDAFKEILGELDSKFSKEKVDSLLTAF